MKKQIITMSAVITVLGLIATGCVSSNRGDYYTRGQARTAHSTVPATIASIREITIEGTEGIVGTIAGGVLGAVVGNTMGGGSGRRVAQVAGGLGGAAAGAALEEAVTRKRGLEITVTFEDGSQLAIPQEISPNDNFYVGQKVNVIKDGMGVMRVRP